MIRDQALDVSGLLVESVGGPSVKPPQPAGVWEAIANSGSNTLHFVADTGAREGPPPQPLHVLEAVHSTASDEHLRRPLARVVRRPPRAHEYAAAGPRAFERDAIHRSGPSARRARAQAPRVDLRASLVPLPPSNRSTSRIARARRAWPARFATSRSILPDAAAEAQKLVAVGETKPDPTLDPVELAAWTMIGNLILNLDEVINKG